MALPFSFETNTNFRGLQTKKALTDFNIEESVSCVGGFFDVTGSFTKRRGGEKYNFTALGNPITGLFDFRFNNNTEQQLIITAGEDIYKGNGGSPVSIYSGQTLNTYYDFANFNDYLWIVNGADRFLKYNGTIVTFGSLDEPANNPTLSPDNLGNLDDGTYQVAVTFVTADGQESNAPFPFSEITLSGVLEDEIFMDDIPTSTDSQVVARNIYMSNTDGAVLFLNQTINDNVTTTGNITDFVQGKLLEFDHDPAPDGLIGLEIHKNRLFGFKDNVVYFTKEFDVWYWPQGIGDPTVNFSFIVDSSAPITGIKSFFDFLLIFKEDDIFILSGDNELNFRLDRLKSDERIGAVSNRAITIIGNYCYFLGINSFYRTNGITVDDVGENLSDFFSQNSKSFEFKLNKNFNQNACAISYKELNLWLVFVTTGSSLLNNMCFALDVFSLTADPSNGKISADWCPWPGFISTQSVTNVVENGFDKWFRGDDLGFIFRQEQLNGDGSNVTSFSTGGNTATTLNDTNQNFTVNSLTGLRIDIVGGTGEGQVFRILSNTATQITIDGNFSIIPDATSEYTIGGPYYHYEHAWDNYGNPSLSKRWRYSRVRFQTSGDYGVTLEYQFDFNSKDTDKVEQVISGQTLWDISMWDVNVWDGTILFQEKLPVHGSRIHRWSNFRLENNKSNQPINYLGFDKIFQVKGVR